MSKLIKTPAPLRSTARQRWAAAAAVVSALSSSLSQAADLYAPDIEYPRGSVVLAADGNEYRASDKVTGKDPVTAKDSPWRVRHIASSITLDVPGRFPSIEAALDFLGGGTIEESAVVTIKVAAGTYDMDRPLSLGHHQGPRVELTGARDPADTVLNFGTGSGIVVDSGRSVRLRNLTLQGGQTGLVVDHRSHAELSQVHVRGFRIGVLVERGSSIMADVVSIESNDGDWGVKVTSTSYGRFTKCVVKRTKPSTSTKDLTFGIDAVTSASVEVVDCSISGWMTGVQAGRSAAIELYDSKITGNVFGGSVYLSATLSAFSSAFDENRERGLQVLGGAACVQNCTFRKNPNISICSSSNGLVDFVGAPSTISDSKIGLESFHGGRFHGVEPKFGRVESKTSGPEEMFYLYR